MKKIITAFVAGAVTLSVAACNTPGERAAGGAVVGAATARPACPGGYYLASDGYCYPRY